jgi:bifunctional DNA-binding transcriptional regulator/antitoxin component of YhaV-PrlF toxin-antitoxin module
LGQLAQQKQKEGPISKVSVGGANSALRLYIPASVAREMGLKSGDSVRWAVIQEDGKLVAKFRKVKVVVSVSDA